MYIIIKIYIPHLLKKKLYNLYTMSDILKTFSEIISNSNNPVVLEFGCCDGYHTSLMLGIIKEHSSTFTYHAFEPNPKLISRIKNGFAKRHDGSFTLFNCAIGAKNEAVDFWISDGYKRDSAGKILDHYYGSSSIRKPTKLMQESWKDMTFEKTTVDCRTLDFHYNNSKELKDKIIDFIWADIQGAEKDLILGGLDIFKKYVKYFYTEYNQSEVYEGLAKRDEIIEMLSDFEIVEDYGGDVLLKNKNLQ
jgi:FkbM family methyltransferase